MLVNTCMYGHACIISPDPHWDQDDNSETNLELCFAERQLQVMTASHIANRTRVPVLLESAGEITLLEVGEHTRMAPINSNNKTQTSRRSVSEHDSTTLGAESTSKEGFVPISMETPGEIVSPKWANILTIAH